MAKKLTLKIKNINLTMINCNVIFYGWIDDIRKLSKITFIIVRDVTGSIQVVIKEQILKTQLNKHTVLKITGIVTRSKSHNFDIEIYANDIIIISKAKSQLPLDQNKNHDHLDTRLNARALDVRNPKILSIFKLRHNVLISIRKFLVEQKFIEINTPKIIGNASEGGANLFHLPYFNKNAYLAQSPQLYKEQMILGLERVFEIANFYRAEKSHTLRHLTEYTSVDIEASFLDYHDVMKLLELMIKSIYQFLNQNCYDEITLLNCKIPNITTPFKSFTYAEIITKLNGLDEKIEYGDDLIDSNMKKLNDEYNDFYFITDWPLLLKPFYIKEHDQNSSLSQSFDLQYGGLELSSGGTRLNDHDKIKSRLQSQNINHIDFLDHLKSFEWGMPPHSGWGLGFDRLMMIITNINNIREVVLYPRDPDRLIP